MIVTVLEPVLFGRNGEIGSVITEAGGGNFDESWHNMVDLLSNGGSASLRSQAGFSPTPVFALHFYHECAFGRLVLRIIRPLQHPRLSLPLAGCVSAHSHDLVPTSIKTSTPDSLYRVGLCVGKRKQAVTSAVASL